MATKESQKAKPKKRHSPNEKKSDSSSILDESTKRDIIGVIFVILAIAILLIVSLPADDALVSSVASEYMKLVFGVGAYILPFVLAAIGATFLYRSNKQRVPVRAAIGLTIVFIGLLGFISLFAPISSLGHDDPTLLFTRAVLMGYGGYIGSGISFALISAVGKIVSGVILFGVMIVGIVIVGFSVTKTIELVKKKQEQLRERISHDKEKTDTSSRFARVRKAPDVSMRTSIEDANIENGYISQESDNATRPLRDVNLVDKPRRRLVAEESPYSMPSIPDTHDVAEYEKDKIDRSYNTIPITLEPLENDKPASVNASYRFSRSDAYDDTMLTQPFDPVVTNQNARSNDLIESNPFPSRLPVIGAAANKNHLTSQNEDMRDEDIVDDGLSFDPSKWSYTPTRQSFEPDVARPSDQSEIEIPAFLRSDTRKVEPLPSIDQLKHTEPEEENRSFIQPHVVKLDHLDLLDGTTIPVFNEPRKPLDETLSSMSAIDVLDESEQVDVVDHESCALDSESTSSRSMNQNAAEPRSMSASEHSRVVSSSKKMPSKRTSFRSNANSKDGFILPDMSLLAQSDRRASKTTDEQELSMTAQTLQQTLEDFGVKATVVGWIAGPTVTLFKVELPSGVRVSRVTNLTDDIALALAAPGVRIFAPIPGTNYVGIEVPNRTRQTVLLSEVLKDAGEGPLQIAIGKDVEGNSIVSDLAKMPHLLIGGTTGSGKSVSINAMIMSILMRATPDEVRFIMIDPKRVEFTPYNGIPHLYVPVVTEPKEAASALSWGVAEMERRLKIFSKIGARNIAQYNAKVESGNARIDDEEDLKKLPYIVIIIDELADLMMNVGKEVEFSISRIAQLARAAGIHLIVATQRPSTNVVTGLIKANITNRIAFNVASGIDSRVILDTPGAESLIGLGDMLLSKPELAKPQRIQACFVSEDEINDVVDFIKDQGEQDYHQEILTTNLITIGASNPQGGSGGDDDPLVWDAAEVVVSTQIGSTSNIQRRFKVGYSRAGRIMDQLEEKGIVGPANGSKPREVLVDEMELETIKAFELADE